jgi:ectoine hydroxylase-related dioxygenase (phytanoyl-CoA dioxygenase family)
MQKINNEISLVSSKEMGSLGIMHLKRYWQKCQYKKINALDPNAFAEEWNNDITVLAALGLGLEQTLKYIYNASDGFDGFEKWILSVNNQLLDIEKIKTFNTPIAEDYSPISDEVENVLTETDINFWNENGYVIIRNSVPINDCAATVNIICNFLEIDEHDASTWYHPHEHRQGIMVQLFQDAQLEKNRLSIKIRKAYEQLWQRKDIWVNADRVGFNPPETNNWKFPGPKLHWDVSLKQPIPFGLQGILYLTDTKENQGAFSLIPGFQNKIKNWLNELLETANPRNENLYALGVKGIEANAGDFIIWHHALPHGSSVNTSDKPRFVQYINYAPIDAEVRDEWI